MSYFANLTNKRLYIFPYFTGYPKILIASHKKFVTRLPELIFDIQDIRIIQDLYWNLNAELFVSRRAKNK